MKKFSVIIYNLDNIEELITTITSILDNNYISKEILIVDEFQTKNKQLEELVRKHHIKMINSNEIKGIYNMINLGIKMCEGDYILLGTSGVNYNSKILLNLSKYFEENHNVLEFNIHSKFEYDFTKIAFTNKIIKDIGYFDTYDLYSDWDFRYRINKVFNIKQIKINFIEEISNNFINPSKSIIFKNYFSSHIDRVYIPYQNCLKYDDIIFDKSIYSNIDILMTINFNNSLINCTQYIKIKKDNKYYLVNINNKTNITILDDCNAYKLSNNFFYFKSGFYTIKYDIDIDEISVSPIIIAFYNQII